ncbi:MAG: LUD domain-containing protein [Dermatophilaceae bacterium]
MTETAPALVTDARVGEDDTSARSEILDRLHHALRHAPAPDRVERGYRHTAQWDSAHLCDLLVDRLLDYKAEVVRCGASQADMGTAVMAVLHQHGAGRVVAPPAVVEALLAFADVEVVPDSPGLTARDLDAIDAVVTGAALAIADTGVLVLDGDRWCGRRAITLVPDLHVCVVRTDQVVGLVPEAIARLDPTRPQTWIAGPSATSDIELDRVEGVHGPRTLIVVLAG